MRTSRTLAERTLIIGAVARATGSYDPELEAVVVWEAAISFTVSIERNDGCETAGAVNWSPVN
jgi:hypothetical protein